LYTEYLCEKEREVLVTEDINEQIQDVVSETIVNELTKYSLRVDIGQESIDLAKFSFAERKSIINTLPAFLLEKALDYIVSCRKSIENLLTIKVSEDKEELLQINGVFFSTI
jgi:endonuclease III